MGKRRMRPRTVASQAAPCGGGRMKSATRACATAESVSTSSFGTRTRTSSRPSPRSYWPTMSALVAGLNVVCARFRSQVWASSRTRGSSSEPEARRSSATSPSNVPAAPIAGKVESLRRGTVSRASRRAGRRSSSAREGVLRSSPSGRSAVPANESSSPWASVNPTVSFVSPVAPVTSASRDASTPATRQGVSAVPLATASRVRSDRRRSG